MVCGIKQKQLFLAAMVVALVTISGPNRSLGQVDFFSGVSDITLEPAGTAAAYYDGSNGDVHLSIGDNLSLITLEFSDTAFSEFGSLDPDTVLALGQPTVDIIDPSGTSGDFGQVGILSLFTPLTSGIFNLGSILPAGARNAEEFHFQIASEPTIRFGGQGEGFAPLFVINIPALPGDFNDDGSVDGLDVDFYADNIGRTVDEDFDLLDPMDLDLSGFISFDDFEEHITTLVQTPHQSGTFIGDLNLDGDVDVSEITFPGPVNNGDASILLANLGTTFGAGYANGDLNADGDVDVTQIVAGPGGVQNVGDASRLLANLGSSQTSTFPSVATVPEPGVTSTMWLICLGLCGRRRKQNWLIKSA